jgi:uncharacterized phage protein (TIGR01671 family)
MSREIKFRGIRLDGKGWVYGYYSLEFERGYHSQGMDDVPPRCSYISNDSDCFEVDVESVGQLIGLTDSIDIDICDGDELSYTIFDHNDNDKQYTGVVKWFGSGFVVTQVPDDQGNGEYGIDLFWIHSQDEELEVIGNIHENKN